jgi:hypothetical protein
MITIQMERSVTLKYLTKYQSIIYAILFCILIFVCYKKRNLPDYWRRERYTSHAWGHALLIIGNASIALSIVLPMLGSWITGNSNWMFLMSLVPLAFIYSPLVWIVGLALIWRSRKV